MRVECILFIADIQFLQFWDSTVAVVPLINDRKYLDTAKHVFDIDIVFYACKKTDGAKAYLNDVGDTFSVACRLVCVFFF